jgi:hypothetical protein
MSVILMPANLLLYCNASYDADVVQSIDFNSLFIALTVVISAIGFGLFASAKVHSYRFNIFANRVSSLLEMNDVLLHCNANTSSLLFGNTKYSLETTQEYHSWHSQPSWQIQWEIHKYGNTLGNSMSGL